MKGSGTGSGNNQKAEVIPVNDVVRLNNQLISLKGYNLTIDELELVGEIVNSVCDKKLQ